MLDPRVPPIVRQVIPRESAAVFISGVKPTSDVTKETHFAQGQKEAETFDTIPLEARDKNGIRDKHGGLVWNKEAFDAVDWRALDATLHNKPQIYKQWLTKQCSGFCGTQTMVAYWDINCDGKCPNCKKPETVSHLNLCGDAERTRFFMNMTD